MYYSIMAVMSTRADELAEAMLAIVAADGLDALSVRTVAERCQVSIGTVQYHYPTKELMLVGAFSRVVTRAADRVRRPRPGTSPRQALNRALEELLPLDAERRAEAKVVLAFAAAAATTATLAAIQVATLERVIAGVAEGMARARGADGANGADRLKARVAVAAVDGLALHAVSAPGTLRRADLINAVDELLRALLD